MKIIVFLLFAAVSLHTTFAGAVTPADSYGRAVPGQIPSRTVVLSQSTRFINVTDEDVVEFVHNQDKIVWKFDGFKDAINLQDVLPTTFVDHRVMVYVDHISGYR